jgi:hypothetical protein
VEGGEVPPSVRLFPLVIELDKNEGQVRKFIQALKKSFGQKTVPKVLNDFLQKNDSIFFYAFCPFPF